MFNDDDGYCWHFIFSEFVRRVRDNLKAALMPEKENEDMPVFLSSNMLDKKGKLTKVGHYRPFPDRPKREEKAAPIVTPAVSKKTKKEPAAEDPERKESKRDRLRREIEELRAKLNKSERF